LTLRVTLEIVPFGVEANKRTIYQFDISNMGSRTKAGKTRYKMLQKHPAIPDSDNGSLFLHKREKGALALARKVLQRLEPSHGY
jgi:hypothetical protein